MPCHGGTSAPSVCYWFFTISMIYGKTDSRSCNVRSTSFFLCGSIDCSGTFSAHAISYATSNRMPLLPLSYRLMVSIETFARSARSSCFRPYFLRSSFILRANTSVTLTDEFDVVVKFGAAERVLIFPLLGTQIYLLGTNGFRRRRRCLLRVCMLALR